MLGPGGKNMFLGGLSNYKSHFGLIFLAAAFVGGPAVRHASADVMYRHTGNAFDTFPSGASCPLVCNVTGSFVVAPRMQWSGSSLFCGSSRLRLETR